MPIWVMILQAADDWHVPPWVVEEDATADWWTRWRCWREERTAWEKSKDKST